MEFKINMDKTSDQVTKDPRSVEQGKKSYESLMERLKENIQEDNQLPTPSTSSSTCDPHLRHLFLHMTLHPLHLPLHVILISMALVCLLSLSSVLVYFLHLTLFLKNKPMKERSTTKTTSYE